MKKIKDLKKKIIFFAYIYLNKFFLFLFFLPFLFLFVVSEEININGVCLFVSMCIRRSTNGFQACCVVCTFASFVFFLCCVVLVQIYIYICIIYIYLQLYTYITKSVRGLNKREREKVKKKSNTSTTNPRSLSLLYKYVSFPRLTSSSSILYKGKKNSK